MKLLLDSCVWKKAREDLVAAGHDVVHAGDWPDDPGDEEILQRAHLEGRVLVTLDKDFGELVIIQGLPHGGIIRLVKLAAREQGVVCAAAIARYEAILQRGAIVTVEPSRVRIRAPDDDAT